MINLKPLTKITVSSFYKWLNDETVIKYSLSKFQRISTEEEIDAWHSEILNDTKNYIVGIFLAETSELIGYTGICDISNTNMSGEFFIFIGAKQHWGKGYGTLATLKVIDYGFNGLKLNRIMLTVSEPNIGAIHSYSKAGFKVEGKLRQACYRDGEYHDKVMMSILKEEFNKTMRTSTKSHGLKCQNR